MNPTSPSAGPEGLSREELLRALFANLVIQQTNTALVLLGEVPNPETGERAQDLESAKLFIDQLEMLEVKTKGNLDSREEHLLKQSLTTLRMAFVDAVGSGPSNQARPTPASQPAPSPAAPTQSSTAAPGSATPPPPAEEHDESRKKFSKKY